MKEKRIKRRSVQGLKSGHYELGERFDSKGLYAVHDTLIQDARVVPALYNSVYKLKKKDWKKKTFLVSSS